jgi:NADH:ubiquinone oxidoreductase subunit E
MDEVSLQYIDESDKLLLTGFSGRKDELISLLQHYQKKDGYISQTRVRQIADFLKISEAKIFGVTSFYTQFRFKKPGDIMIRVCLGTACHVQGGERISVEIQNILGIAPGEISQDGRFELQQVACLGCCAQAPLVEINGKIFGKMNPNKLRKVLKKYEEL